MLYQERPLLIDLKGHPGVGKSAAARLLGRRLGVPVIDKDDIKDVLDGHARDPGDLAYRAMFTIARRQMSLGLSVICDSPLSEAGGYALANAMACDAAARLVVVECICSSEAEWRRRIEERGALGLPSHHVTSWETLEAHLRRRAAASSYPIDAPHLRVDTAAPLEEVARQVISWLAAGSGGDQGSPAE
jgi:predicted kinase